MKFTVQNTLIHFLVLVLLSVSGCQSSGKAETYGTFTGKAEVAKVGVLLKDAEAHLGKELMVEGVIESECPAGCWLNLKDDGAVIYVTLSGAGIAIPQIVGKTIQVEGEVKIRKDKSVIFVGSGVLVK